MSWYLWVAVVLLAITASFGASKEFSPNMNKWIGIIGADLLFIVLIVNFFLSGWLWGLIGAVIGVFVYLIARRSH